MGQCGRSFPIRNLFLQLKKHDLEALKELLRAGPCRDLPMAAPSAAPLAGIVANLHFEKPFIISLPPLPPPATRPELGELFLLVQGLEKGGIVQIFLIFWLLL